MFKSQLTGKQYGPKEKQKRVVVETRNVTYDNKGKITYSTEIVREMILGQDEELGSK